MTCPAVIEVITPGPPGPPGDGSTTLTGPAVLGRAETTPGFASALPLGTGLSIVNGALTATGATNLGYDPATRELSSSTGADVTLPLVSTTAAGLLPHTWLTGAEPAIFPHIHGDIAGKLYFHVKNVSGTTLPIGTPVCIVGAVGDTTTVEVVAADASDPTKMPAAGILGAALTATGAGASGHAVIAGELTGIPTSAFALRTSLFVAAGGGLAAAPPANGIAQSIGSVSRSHATTGSVAVLVGTALARAAYTGAYGDLLGLPVLGNSASRNVGTTAGTVAAGDAVAALAARLDQFRDARTFYVSKRVAASDSNNGTSEGEPFLTIGAAVSAANDYITANPGAKAKIHVGPGRFVEPALPLRLKPGILIQGALQRATTIQPAAGQELNSILAVDSGCMICDLTFAGHQAQNTSPTDSTAGQRAWAITFNEQANGGAGVILTASPYIKDCLSLTAEDDAGEAGSTSTGDCGGGVEVDGAKCHPSSPIRSMVVYGFTQQNLGGPGAIVKNEGYAELVSFFGLFGTWHVRAESGGQVTMSGGGCSEFGTYGLMADGYSPTAIFSGTLLANAAQGDTTVDVGSLTANRIGTASRPGPGQLMILAGTIYVVQSATPITGGFRVAFYSPTSAGLAAAASTGAAVNFRLRSQINAGCHTCNYVGSGTNYSALPWNGGVPIRANEAVETNYGRVFGAIVNDIGDFKIAGGAFAVDGTTGAVTINTSSFNLSGLNAIGPFSRNGGISTVGVQLQEVSNNITLLASTGVSDGNTAPTQYAVGSYTGGKFLQGLTVTAGQPISVSDTSTTDGQGFGVLTRNIALSLNTANGLLRLDGSGLVPYDRLIVGTTANTVAAGNDARLSDAREWTATTVDQAEAEAGTATTRRAWTAQRVRQAIAAWWSSTRTAPGAIGGTTPDTGQFTGIGIGGVAPRTGYAAALGSGVFSRAQVVTVAGSTYSCDIRTGTRFILAAAIAGNTTIQFTNVADLTTGTGFAEYVEVEVDFRYTSGVITVSAAGFTTVWDGNAALVPTAGEIETLVVRITPAISGTPLNTATLYVASMRGRA